MDDAARHLIDRSAQVLERPVPDPSEMAERIDQLILLERQRRQVEAAQLRILASLPAAAGGDPDDLQEQVSLALQVSLRAAQARLARARTLTDELPRTLAAVADGSISADHAAVLAEAVWRMPPDQALPAALEAAVLPALLTGTCMTVPQLRRQVRRAVLAVDPATAAERHQRARADRKVLFLPDDDGMVSLSAFLSAPEAQLIYTRLTAAASLLPTEDSRTLDQRRADLLVDAVLSGLPDSALPSLRGRRPTINVVVSADTLLGLDDQPAHLSGYGPITAETARRLAADSSGTWRRLLTDPDTGALLDLGADRYRPAQRLRDFVVARDDVCAFPTCNQPGYRCEFEHIKAFERGGRTVRENAALACRRHNRLKQHGTGWQYRRNPDGGYGWETRSGHRYAGAVSATWQAASPTGRGRPVTNPEDSVSTDVRIRR